MGAKINEQMDESDFLDKPRLFIFVLGGLSHHEICSIAELQNELRVQIIPGSNEILTASAFFKQLLNLHKVDIKKLSQGDTTYMEEFAQTVGLTTAIQTESSVDLDDVFE